MGGGGCVVGGWVCVWGGGLTLQTYLVQQARGQVQRVGVGWRSGEGGSKKRSGADGLAWGGRAAASRQTVCTHQLRHLTQLTPRLPPAGW